MTWPDVELAPAGVINPGSPPMVPSMLTYEQFVSLVAKDIIDRGYVGGGGGGGIDPVPLIEEHRVDTTNVHGIANTASLVLTGDSRLSDARPPTTHTHSEADVSGLSSDLAAKAPSVHNHDTQYYTEAEVDALLASLSLSVSWQTLNINPLLASLGDPFMPTVQVGLLGPILVFRGVVSIPGGAGGGFLIATLPGSFPAPSYTRRLVGAQPGNSVAHMNLWPDRTITTGASTGDWIALDSAMCVLP